MEHAYLFEPAVWRACGTYFDAEGRSFPLTGEVRLSRTAEEWTLTGWMEAASDPVQRFTNDYRIEAGDSPCTLRWQSENPALGTMRGTFEVVGPYILSSYRSADGAYSGTETLLQIDGQTYENAGVAFAGGRRMSAWTAHLTRS